MLHADLLNVRKDDIQAHRLKVTMSAGIDKYTVVVEIKCNSRLEQISIVKRLGLLHSASFRKISSKNMNRNILRHKF